MNNNDKLNAINVFIDTFRIRFVNMAWKMNFF